MRLKFVIQSIIIDLVVSIVVCFQCGGLYFLVIHMHKYAVIEVDDVSIKETYLVVDGGGNAYVVELVHVFKPPISIHILMVCDVL